MVRPCVVSYKRRAPTNSPPSLFELPRDSVHASHLAGMPSRSAKAGRRRRIRTADPLGVNEML
jgi:hypothetical protein